MKMRYFRFLYGETSACMVHFGEVNDTKMNETFTFLFIRGNDVQGEQKNGKQNVPFLFPDSADLVILGNVNESVTMVWNELQQHVKVGTLIVPDVPETEKLSLEHVGEVVCLRPVLWDGLSVEKLPDDSLWKTVTAGWQMQVLCWRKGSLAVWHDAAENFADDSLEGLHTEKKGIREFIDCVMSVKATENSICCENRNPDHYGCAMGCVLHRDYDVCKFRYANRANPYLTGTLLTAGNGEAEDQKGLLKWLSGKADGVRFYSVQSPGTYIDIPVGDEALEPGCRKYVIGLSDEVSDQEAAGLCRKGFGSAPVLLTEGHGVCCSGFLKYMDEEK